MCSRIASIYWYRTYRARAVSSSCDFLGECWAQFGLALCESILLSKTVYRTLNLREPSHHYSQSTTVVCHKTNNCAIRWWFDSKYFFLEETFLFGVIISSLLAFYKEVRLERERTKSNHHHVNKWNETVQSVNNIRKLERIYCGA